MEKEYAEYLLKKTKQNYNLIAEDFSRTREYIPEERKKLLLQYIMPGERVLDWGCGNGRFYEALKEIDYYGVDISEKMIEIAKAKYPKAKFQVVEPLSLPFPNNFFDKIFSFAVFHHIPSDRFRLQFLKEARRVLKPEGFLILTAWNLNPLRMILIGEEKRFFSFIKFSILKILGKSKLDFKDFYIPWRNLCQRYVHCFSKSEIKNLVKESELKIEEIGILKSHKTKESNIYLVAKK
jgi:ubiquinone/menaquinone biosynthesis C-methylase UbiE